MRMVVAANSHFGRVVAPAPLISTKAELEGIDRIKAKPEPQHKPSPPRGVIGADLQSEGQKLLEERANHLRQRLKCQREKMNLHRLRSVHEGRAKSGFNAKAQSRTTDRDR